MTPTITTTTFTNPSIVFDLLIDSSLNEDLPILTITPDGCFSIAWNMHRTADDLEWVSLFPSNYAIPVGGT